ncbi:efflux RND transporter permease subunit [Salinarimonas ramus]|uniref:Acriflavin resistance protein n=1 Tax=Salinarimonas ramus TaxID=690164 RepID=A0A917V268_9HYPH|nr:efflux RND transporter permease subunit [Salinarimonas ramus]GGK20077.1 acriflavin resistance protein [Salinarimonas ramus]
MDTFFYRNPRLLWLAILTAVALGTSALLTIARQEDPTITNLFATIVTTFPGAAPDRVEALVTEPLEAELRTLAEIEVVESASAAGVSSVTIELSQFLPEDGLEEVWSEVRDAVDAAARRFPPGASAPVFDNDRAGAFTAIVAIVPREGVEVPPSILRRTAEELQDRLRRVPETRLVKLYGAPEEEVVVTLDPARLAALGLTASEVSRAIAAADAKVAAGQVRGARGDLLIEVEGAIEDLSRVREIPVRLGADGTSVRVADLGTVARAERLPPPSLAVSEGSAGVLVAARMEADRQVDVWSAALADTLDQFREELPGGLEARLVFDQAQYTAARLGELGANLALGVSLVIVVLLLTLGWRAALIVAAVIPLAALVSITIMQRTGITIQQMSVTGLIVALGLLVDAAIVMTDEIRRRIAEGVAPLAAVGQSVRRLAAPLLASTVTTVLAFLPMALLPGPAGDFVGSIALAVIIMLFASLAIALTITPALAGRLLAQTRGGQGGMLSNGVTIPVLGRLFDRSIALALRHKLAALALSLALPVAGFMSFPTLTAQFFPGVERDQLYVQVLLPAGTAIGETARIARAADAVMGDAPEIVSTHWVVGESAPAFYYNMQANRDATAHFAEALVFTQSPDATDALIPRLQAELDAALPQAQILVRGLVQGPPVSAPLEMRLVGPDLETLRRLGAEARALMADIPSVIHTRATLEGGAPKLVFRLDEDEVRLAGLDLASVAAQLQTTLEGATGGSLLEETEELPVRVRVGEGVRGDLSAVRGLDMVAAGGAAAGEGHPGIPLSALGDWEMVPSESPIARRGGERINVVQGYLAHGILPEEALGVLQARLAEGALALPEGYRLEFGGDSDARAETVRNLVSTLGLVVTLTVVTIVLTFLSYRLALVAGAVCVLSFGLSVLALALLQMPFGVQALIGAIGSIGVSINAAIIVITAIQEDEAARTGDLDAIRAVVVRSARHIVSTTVTTVGGFLPLILAGGGFWPPFAVAIAGGVLLSTVVSFYFTPTLVALVLSRRGRNAVAALPSPA